jgi:NADH dehydrogenase FAD-containing subunit
MFVKFSSLRAAAFGSVWPDRTMPSTEFMLKRGKLVRARATSINEGGKKVLLDNGTQVPFDILVVTVGARNFSPGEPPASVTTREGFKEFYATTRSLVENAKQVAIVGAGPVAIELAGEVNAFTKAKVTVVVGQHRFMHGVKPAFTPKQEQMIKNKLASMGMALEQGDALVSPSPPSDMLNDSPVLGKTTLVFASGKKLEVDAVLVSDAPGARAGGGWSAALTRAHHSLPPDRRSTPRRWPRAIG